MVSAFLNGVYSYHSHQLANFLNLCPYFLILLYFSFFMGYFLIFFFFLAQLLYSVRSRNLCTTYYDLYSSFCPVILLSLFFSLAVFSKPCFLFIPCPKLLQSFMFPPSSSISMCVCFLVRMCLLSSVHVISLSFRN